jgi:hypothetical protein
MREAMGTRFGALETTTGGIPGVDGTDAGGAPAALAASIKDAHAVAMVEALISRPPSNSTAFNAKNSMPRIQ